MGAMEESRGNSQEGEEVHHAPVIECSSLQGAPGCKGARFRVGRHARMHVEVATGRLLASGFVKGRLNNAPRLRRMRHVERGKPPVRSPALKRAHEFGMSHPAVGTVSVSANVGAEGFIQSQGREVAGHILGRRQNRPKSLVSGYKSNRINWLPEPTRSFS
jgi:hypothetical protein